MPASTASNRSRRRRRAGRNRGDASYRHDHADLAGIPMPARQQINRQERPEPILHVCQEEIEPIERPLRLHHAPPPPIWGDQREMAPADYDTAAPQRIRPPPAINP